MDCPLQRVRKREAASINDLSRILSALGTGVQAYRSHPSAHVSASLGSGQLGEAFFLSLKAEGLNLEIGPPWTCGVLIGYGGSLRVEQEGSAAHRIHPHEVAIFGSSGLQLGGSCWGALLLMFRAGSMERVSHDVLASALERDHGGLMVIGHAAEGMRALARRSLIALIDYIDLFSNDHLDIPVAFAADKVLTRQITWMATSQQPPLPPTVAEASPEAPARHVVHAIAAEIKENCLRYQSLDQLATRSGYSKRQLQHLFKLHYQCTPMQFIKRIRLVSASERLRSPEAGDRVEVIANTFGWRYSSSFSSEFKREFGISPSVVLRRSLQERLNASPDNASPDSASPAKPPQD